MKTAILESSENKPNYILGANRVHTDRKQFEKIQTNKRNGKEHEASMHLLNRLFSSYTASQS